MADWALEYESHHEMCGLEEAERWGGTVVVSSAAVVAVVMSSAVTVKAVVSSSMVGSVAPLSEVISGELMINL